MKQLLLSIIISSIGKTAATATTHNINNDVRILDQDEPVVHFAGQSLVFDRCFENNVIFRACLIDECDEYIVDM